MPAITLSDAGQDALRALLAHDPSPGQPLPARSTLRAIRRLVPCDAIGVGMADRTGQLEISVALPDRPHPYDGWGSPFRLGLLHLIEHPGNRRTLARLGLTDCLLLAFEAGRDHVLVLSLERVHHRFSEAEVALTRAVAPALHRLVRTTTQPAFPAGLTEQERRVLVLVSDGLSNADIASQMTVAPSTVRKHLEHAFRKLGVSNRLAAVRVLDGAAGPSPRLSSATPSPERV